MDQPTGVDVDLLYGAKAIAECLGLTEKQTRHLVRLKRIPVFRVGGIVCSRRSALARWLDEQLPGDLNGGT